MVYTFTYTLSGADGAITRSFCYDCDSFNVALAALAADLVDTPAGSSITFNSYYRANREYRKFRERDAFEVLFNGLSDRIGVYNGQS